jgi:hypothetical protein
MPPFAGPNFVACASRDGGGSVARLNGASYDAIFFGLKLIDGFVYFCHSRAGASRQTVRGPPAPEPTWYRPQELRGSRLDRRTDPALVGQRHRLRRLRLNAQSSRRVLYRQPVFPGTPTRKALLTTIASPGHTFIQMLLSLAAAIALMNILITDQKGFPCFRLSNDRDTS